MNWRIFKTVYSRKIKWIWTTCINTDTDTYLKLKSIFFSFDFYYLAIGTKLGAKKHTSNIPRYLSYIFNRDDERVHNILYHLITPGRRLRSKIIWFDNHDKKRGVPRGWHELQNCYLCQQPPIFYDNRPLWWDLFQSVKRRKYDSFNNYA